ncbi:hypothetical protein EZV62_000412 [Acer yangbiense]|uniref:F-box domain-containing protein n=1 Tax=Acer yangbiense TaxID=1000413 RepID=A0A5C7IR24_9ROSI|nr:hypothetical protein EZV62_000412 [Acer yangbiense]
MGIKSEIFLNTDPRDACRLACVSTAFRSAADSDIVWDHFLHPEYLSAISDLGSISGLFKKELYLSSCLNPIHKGKLSFWFDLPSGKKCYMISARELNIQNSDCIYAWRWFSTPDAQHRFCIPDGRFPEVVICAEVYYFEIGGKICTSLLSLTTTYVAYIVFAGDLVCDVDYDEVEVSVGLVGCNNGQNQTIYIHRVHQDGDDDGFFPKKREDGWLESELGEFFYEGDEDGELLMTIYTSMKQNFLVQGIEIRPKKE